MSYCIQHMEMLQIRSRLKDSFSDLMMRIRFIDVNLCWAFLLRDPRGRDYRRAIYSCFLDAVGEMDTLLSEEKQAKNS